MVGLEPLDQDEDIEIVKDLLNRHVKYTGSTVAKKMLSNWHAMQPKFIKVMPNDYKRVLSAIDHARKNGIPEDIAVMEAAHG
jgi:glutamate synthase domain-containing protein 3